MRKGTRFIPVHVDNWFAQHHVLNNYPFSH